MQSLPTLALVIIVIAGMTILISRDWRIIAIALGVQYLGVFILVSLTWPINLAVIKLITGWMATAAIAFTCLRHNRSATQPESFASFLFRGLAGLLIVLLIFILSPSVQSQIFPSVDLILIQGGLMMIGLSLMKLGLNSEPYPVIISLFSFLAGFEVIHAALELSSLLTGLFVVVNLGLALTGVYLIVSMEDTKATSEEGDLR